MPTPAEKKALVFLAAVAITGAAVRATGAAASAQTADAASREALRRQIVAVESAGASDRKKRNGVAGVPGQRASRARPSGHPIPPLLAEAPPSSREQVDPRSIFAPPVVDRSSARTTKGRRPDAAPVDMDIASAQEIERLPRIGPALAQRVVKDRDELGAFGSIEGLQRVRGIGPAMARTLAPYVTFSGTPRPSIAGGPGASAAPGGTRKPRVSTGSALERRKRRPVPP